MITNNSVTIYHRIFDTLIDDDIWVRYNYNNVWIFGGKGASINKGYDNANNIDVRLSYQLNDLDANNFAIGDIIVPGTLDLDITTQQDLKDYQIYNITSITDNQFGTRPHIHIGGK